MQTLHIPKPCKEDWNAMTPTQQGAFCGSCQKEVIDFTKMSDEEVLLFFKDNIGKRICGRATVAQANRLNIVIDEKIFTTKIPTWKKYLAILLICFGSMFLSCTNKNIKGELVNGTALITSIKADTSVAVSSSLLGDIKPPPPTPSLCPIIPYKKVDSIEYVNEVYITGDLVMPPPVEQGLIENIIEPPPIVLPQIDSSKVKKDSVPIKVDSCTSKIFS